jgi:predicted alpha/beta-hydrolase family hydrolase
LKNGNSEKVSEAAYIRIVNCERLKQASHALGEVIAVSKIIPKRKMEAMQRQVAEWIDKHYDTVEVE